MNSAKKNLLKTQYLNYEKEEFRQINHSLIIIARYWKWDLFFYQLNRFTIGFVGFFYNFGISLNSESFSIQI